MACNPEHKITRNVSRFKRLINYKSPIEEEWMNDEDSDVVKINTKTTDRTGRRSSTT